MAYNRLSNYKTDIVSKNDNTSVTYHSTVIVEFDPASIILRTGGYKSVTTKRKMNQASHQFGLGYGVTQEKGTWYVTTREGKFEFEGNEFVINR